jgi:hypothetical protein
LFYKRLKEKVLDSLSPLAIRNKIKSDPEELIWHRSLAVFYMIGGEYNEARHSNECDMDSTLHLFVHL